MQKRNIIPLVPDFDEALDMSLPTGFPTSQGFGYSPMTPSKDSFDTEHPLNLAMKRKPEEVANNTKRRLSFSIDDMLN